MKLIPAIILWTLLFLEIFICKKAILIIPVAIVILIFAIYTKAKKKKSVNFDK